MPDPRPIDTNERSILERVLSFEFPGAEGFRTQLDGLKASPGCECGCATINLHVDEEISQRSIDVTNPLPVTGVTADRLGGVIVFQRHGWLTCMEIYNVGDDPIAAFPPADSISFEPDSSAS